MPDFLIDPLIEFKNGNWISLKEHYNSLKQDISKYSVVDFSDIQIDPEGMLKKIAGRMGVSIRQDDSMKPKFIAYNSAGMWEPGQFSPFQAALEHDSILPPLKTPIPMANHPAYTQDALRKTFSIYMELLKDKQRLTSGHGAAIDVIAKKRPDHKSFSEIDPVTSYAFLTADASSSKSEIQKLGQTHPEFQAYFQLIDNARDTQGLRDM